MAASEAPRDRHRHRDWAIGLVTAVGTDGNATQAAGTARHVHVRALGVALGGDDVGIRRGERIPQATSGAEAAFLTMTPMPRPGSSPAAASSTHRVKAAKTAEDVTLSKPHPEQQLTACRARRGHRPPPREGMPLVLDYQADLNTAEPTPASDTHSLQPGTSTGHTRPRPTPVSDTGTANRTDLVIPLRQVHRSAGDPLAEAIALTRRVTSPHIRRISPGDPHREGPTPGPGRGRAHPAGRRGRWTRPRQPAHHAATSAPGSRPGKTFGDRDEQVSSVPRATRRAQTRRSRRPRTSRPCPTYTLGPRSRRLRPSSPSAGRSGRVP